MVLNICQLSSPSSLAFQDQNWLNDSFNKQIITEWCLMHQEERILTQEGEEKRDGEKKPCIPLLPLPCPSSFESPPPSLIFSLYHFLHSSAPYYIISTQKFILKPNQYNTYSFQVGILYLLKFWAVSLSLTTGNTVTQSHSVTENIITTSSLSDHCFLTNNASDPLCYSKLLVEYPIATPASLHKGTYILINPRVS